MLLLKRQKSEQTANSETHPIPALTGISTTLVPPVPITCPVIGLTKMIVKFKEIVWHINLTRQWFPWIQACEFAERNKSFRLIYCGGGGVNVVPIAF